MTVRIRDASRAEACLCSQLVIRQTVRDAVFFQDIHHAQIVIMRYHTRQ
nr:MAG TPA: hypothetical protein [Caudoviricetes sp.]